MGKVVSVPVVLSEDADFKEVYKRFGKKKQKNVPLTEPLWRAVEEEGGAEYLIKLALRDLAKKKKLPKGYEVLLEF
jgi:hypothetical protein